MRLALLAPVFLLAACGGTGSGVASGGTSVVVSASPAAASPSRRAGLADKSFTSTAPLLKDDGLGDFGGTARVTNASDQEHTATFTYTVFRGSAQVATLQGAANAVAPGKVATVQLISQDKYVAGPYRVEFQVDAEF